jgi:predicted amidohydrolase YtcJ
MNEDTKTALLNAAREIIVGWNGHQIVAHAPADAAIRNLVKVYEKAMKEEEERKAADEEHVPIPF